MQASETRKKTKNTLHPNLCPQLERCSAVGSLLLNLSQCTGLKALPEELSALNKSIVLGRQRNVRSLHLAGHARKECGFIWNANDEATASKMFDVEAILLAIGAVAGQQGPLECVVLNACCTVQMGRLLRQQGPLECVVRERPVASAPLPALANTEQTLAANEAVDAGLEGRLVLKFSLFNDML